MSENASMEVLGTSSAYSVPESLSHDINLLLHRDVHEQKKKSSLFLMQLKEERLHRLLSIRGGRYDTAMIDSTDTEYGSSSIGS